jgi:ribulose-phosphate 3-epimerase
LITLPNIANASANQCTFHIEATNEPSNLIHQIHQLNMRAGIALKPNTPIETVFPYLDEVDLILVMTVEPGFGG